MKSDYEGVSIEVKYVTPKLAQTWLDTNKHNRNLRRDTVRAFAEDMAAGNWEPNGESVKFDTDHNLLDGQHRLAAIVKSGQAIPLLVVNNLRVEAQETMDQGMVRKLTDILSLRHEKNVTTLSSSLRAIAQWKAGNIIQHSNRVTSKQLISVLEAHPEIREQNSEVARIASALRVPTRAIGLTYWLFNAINQEDSEFFFNRLTTGVLLEEGDAIYALRKILINWRDSKKYTPNNNAQLTQLLALIIKAWNKYRLGEPCYLLNLRSGGSKPEKFPLPI